MGNLLARVQHFQGGGAGGSKPQVAAEMCFGDGIAPDATVLPLPFAPQLRGIPLLGQGLVGTPIGAPQFGGTVGASFVIR